MTPERIGIDVIEGIKISTVKLPFMHTGGIYETMIFGGSEEIDNYQERYYTEQDAIEGHKEAVELVRKYLGINIESKKV